MPLNWDWFTDLVLLFINTSIFENFLGKLLSDGTGEAIFNCPDLPPAAIGLKLYFAYCCNKPFDFVSNPVEIEIVP